MAAPERCPTTPADLNMIMANPSVHYQCIRRKGHRDTGIDGCVFDVAEGPWDPDGFPEFKPEA